MAEWFNFALYTVSHLVQLVFSLDIGLGFSLGDLDAALILIGLIASALVVKASSSYSIRHELNSSPAKGGKGYHGG